MNLCVRILILIRVHVSRKTLRLSYVSIRMNRDFDFVVWTESE